MHKISLVLLAISLQANDIRISEVMSNPQGSEYENEFIEVYNQSDHVMHINGWLLSDGSGVDTLGHLLGPMELQAQGYAIILDPGYVFATGPYTPLIPDSIPVYTISDGSFGSGGLANTSETVMICSPDSSQVSQMSWSSASENGYSWERVSLDTPDSLAIWKQSLVENGSPGFCNSVKAPPYNLGIQRVMLSPVQLGEAVEITLTFKNTGENAIEGFSLLIFRDENQNDIQDAVEWELSVENPVRIESEDTLDVSVSLFELGSGIHQIEARVFAAGDENRSDDSIRCQVIGSYPMDVVNVSEIMSSPGLEQGGEWLEIRNVSDAAVSLQGWTLSDANLTRHPITDSLLFLHPDCLWTLCPSQAVLEYFTIPTNKALVLESWPTLNATSDSIRLFDATGHLVSRAFYRGTWGIPGVSLERRHPELFPLEEWNWEPSTHGDGGTPSRINTRQLEPVSVLIDSVNIQITHPIGPAPVSAAVHFTNWGLDTLKQLHIEAGISSEWRGNLPSFQSDSLSFTTAELAPGLSSILVRISHDQVLLSDTSIQVILGFPPHRIALNEIHYLPGEDQVEFLEFVNIGCNSLNLDAWSFVDRSGSRGFISAKQLVPPDSLFLLCANAAALGDLTFSQARIFELSAWPSLNNTSDSIIILDPLGNRQLAHGYDESQGGETGKSLERLALWKPAEVDASWATCCDPRGITPGLQNSVLVPPCNLELIALQIIDSLLWADKRFSIQTQLINAGVSPAQSASLSVQVFQEDGQQNISKEELPTLSPGDTIYRETEIEVNQGGWIEIIADIFAPDDELYEDNHQSLVSYVSCNQSPIIINEIMPIPAPDQVEWIEIYNRSDRHVDLHGWLIADNSLNGKLITDSSLVLASDRYLILTDQSDILSCPEGSSILAVSGWPSLNNSEDAVILLDPQGIRMDEMSYDNYTPLAEGRSLERIRTDAPGSDPRNWGICIDECASTPGTLNSLHLTELASELNIELSPNPFTPNGDGREDELVIHYELTVEQGLLSVSIFDMAGRKIAEPALAKAISHRGVLSWNGEASYGGIAVTGLYICQLMIDDQQGKVTKTLKKIYLVR